MSKLKTAIAPILVLVVAAVVSVGLVSARPGADEVPREAPEPLVRVVEVFPEQVQFVVDAQGTVLPQSQIALVAEVEGKVIEVSPKLSTGSFFDSGDVLLRIDPRQYELAVASAKADVAASGTAVVLAKAEATVARRDWLELHPDTAVPSLVARQPQVAEAQARLDAARARLARAQLDLDRTTLTAPFAGRVASEDVALQRFVARGTTLATVFSTAVAEIRLPVADRELAFLDISLGRKLSEGDAPVGVRFTATFAGSRHQWSGEVVRVEGGLDPRTRMVGLVAEVRDPYSAGTVPLAVGMFVNAEILGRTRTEVFVLPREALREDQRILVVDDDNRLQIVEAEVLRTQPGRVMIGAGLRAGQRVCVSPLEVIVDGMRVRVAEPAQPAQPEGISG